jgi:hypothetical protein
MAKISNRQLALKPQDLFVLLALLSRGEGGVTYPELAAQTGLAISAVHGALKRAAGLLMSDPAAAAARVTYDVDLVVEVAALHSYHRMEAEFSRLGFIRDLSAAAPICRWRFRDLEADLMPTDPHILGCRAWWPRTKRWRSAWQPLRPGCKALRCSDDHERPHRRPETPKRLEGPARRRHFLRQLRRVTYLPAVPQNGGRPRPHRL